MTRKKETEIEIHDSEEARQPASDGEQSNGNNEPAEKLSEEEKLRQELNELEDRLLRTVAEFDNYKKRQARQYEDTVRRAADRVLADLLEISDNLGRALEHGEGGNSVESLRQGTEMIHNQMQDLLARYGVTPIEALGRPFDPNLHEALMRVASDEYEEGMVALEISKGYKRGDHVLRHARVGVSSGPSEPDHEEQ
jgi:molecular chaperone GrpE